MTAEEYLLKFYPEVKKVENETGFSAIAMLAQSAGESGWKEPKGNMFFGVKDTDGLNGNEQLIRTTEYLSSPNVKFPKVYSVTPINRGGKTIYKYDCEDWFEKYDSPADAFRGYVDFIKRNPRYKKAIEVKHDPVAYLTALAEAGYATGLNYKDFMLSMIKSVTTRLIKLKLI
jgi:flagellar protein FlgJ